MALCVSSALLLTAPPEIGVDDVPLGPADDSSLKRIVRVASSMFHFFLAIDFFGIVDGDGSRRYRRIETRAADVADAGPPVSRRRLWCFRCRNHSQQIDWLRLRQF